MINFFSFLSVPQRTDLVTCHKMGRHNIHTTRGLSGYRARRRVADSRGPVVVAGVSEYVGDRGPTPPPQGVMCGLP
jgi:hypothetical protein